MLRGVSTFGLLVGLAIGFPAGMAFAVGRRAWRDLNSTKALVGGVRKTAWRMGRVAMTWIIGLAVLVVAALTWAAGGGAAAPLACPLPSTSVSPSAAPPSATLPSASATCKAPR